MISQKLQPYLSRGFHERYDLGCFYVERVGGRFNGGDCEVTISRVERSWTDKVWDCGVVFRRASRAFSTSGRTPAQAVRAMKECLKFHGLELPEFTP